MKEVVEAVVSGHEAKRVVQVLISDISMCCRLHYANAFAFSTSIEPLEPRMSRRDA